VVGGGEVGGVVPPPPHDKEGYVDSHRSGSARSGIELAFNSHSAEDDLSVTNLGSYSLSIPAFDNTVEWVLVRSTFALTSLAALVCHCIVKESES
jgi:hypothetical protein